MNDNRAAEWPDVRLGDYATVKARLGWKGLKAGEYILDGPIFLAAPNLRGGRIDFDNVDHVPQWRYDESPEIQLAEGDVLLVKDGSTLGMSGIVKTVPAPTTVNGSIAVIRPRTSLVSSFLYYSINGQRFQRLVWLRRSGLGVPHLFQADLRGFRISLPSVPEQCRMSEVLSTIDEEIEQTEALIAKYQQIKAGLMQDLFTRGLTSDGRLRPLWSETPRLYETSPLGWLPREWEMASVGSCLVGIDAGKSPECPDTPASGDQWGVLKVGAVDPNGLRENENKVVGDERLYDSAFLVRDNDLLLSRANTIDLVGMVCHVSGNVGNLMLSDKTLRLHPDPARVTTRFLFWALQSPFARRQMENLATGTSGSMKNISQRGLRSIGLPRPEISEQSLITLRLDAAVDTISTLRVSLAKLRNLERGLGHDLITGRVRVNVEEAVTT